MRKNKMIIICIAVAIIVLLMIVKLAFPRNYQNTVEKITMKEYQNYNTYGIIYDGSESEIFNFLKDRLNINDFKQSAEAENIILYNGTSDANVKLISSLLNDCKQIKEVLYTKESIEGPIVCFTIDYINNSKKRIVLEYTKTGLVRKTLREEKSVITISSDLKKEVYSIKRKELLENNMVSGT